MLTACMCASMMVRRRAKLTRFLRKAHDESGRKDSSSPLSLRNERAKFFGNENGVRTSFAKSWRTPSDATTPKTSRNSSPIASPRQRATTLRGLPPRSSCTEGAAPRRSSDDFSIAPHVASSGQKHVSSESEESSDDAVFSEAKKSTTRYRQAFPRVALGSLRDNGRQQNGINHARSSLAEEQALGSSDRNAESTDPELEQRADATPLSPRSAWRLGDYNVIQDVLPNSPLTYSPAPFSAPSSPNFVLQRQGETVRRNAGRGRDGKGWRGSRQDRSMVRSASLSPYIGGESPYIPGREDSDRFRQERDLELYEDVDQNEIMQDRRQKHERRSVPEALRKQMWRNQLAESVIVDTTRPSRPTPSRSPRKEHEHRSRMDLSQDMCLFQAGLEGAETGSAVVLVGLQSRLDLNGTFGVLGAFDANSMRYDVQVDGEEDLLALRPINLRLARGRIIPSVRSADWMPELGPQSQQDEATTMSQKNPGSAGHLYSAGARQDSPAPSPRATADDFVPAQRRIKQMPLQISRIPQPIFALEKSRFVSMPSSPRISSSKMMAGPSSVERYSQSCVAPARTPSPMPGPSKRSGPAIQERTCLEGKAEWLSADAARTRAQVDGWLAAAESAMQAQRAADAVNAQARTLRSESTLADLYARFSAEPSPVAPLHARCSHVLAQY